MSPLTRPASPWKIGSQPLRTADGKIMPYQPYSKLQSAWTTLIFAPMGFGKSMFMNYCNLSLILSPDNTELPFISILDIGPSSRGLISLLRGALPKEKRHLAMYERLLNTREYSVNVFDTRLGLRKPLSNQKAFLVNFLSYLATPDDKSLPPDGVLGMADTLVDLAYTVCSDRKSAKTYQPEIIPVIDELLIKIGFEYSLGKTKWWDVVDFLYQKGYSHEATLAQRYAVPNLLNISHLVNDSRIEAVYGDAHVKETTEKLPKFFWRKITEAINKYPIISEETKFDLGEARIVSLDLDEVAKGQGADAKRRTGLMYMVSYYILTNRFFTGKEHLGEMPGEVGIYDVDYRPYHMKYVESIKKMPKRFCIDEKHRVRGLGMVESQLDESIREGRKWKVEIMQASQLPDDFSDESVRLATNIFILGGGNKANCEKVAQTFKLSATMTQHLNESLRKPNKHGATLLSILETEKGDFEQLLMSTQGPTFLWACNSSSDDAYVRDTLAGEIGDIDARALLVEIHPAGNLDDEIEKRKRLAGLTQRKQAYQGEDLSNRDLESEETPKGILNDIIQDLLAIYKSRDV
jgi:intracellular multiplication protein IcmB